LLGEGSLAYGDMPLSLRHPGECQSSVHDTTIPDIRRRPGDDKLLLCPTRRGDDFLQPASRARC
jgi:hypothetical protein